jgi:glutamyl-tRNA reductase
MNRGAVLAEELGSKQIPFETIPDSLIDFDILITSTAATEPIIEASEVRNVMATRPNRHLHVLDVGMPRDVDPESASIDGVHLISLTDLQKKSSENWELREEAGLQARELIEDGIRHFKERLSGISSEPVIRTLGARVERMRQEEVERTLGRHEELTEEQAAAVEKMTRSLVRRILSDPISFLRSDDDSADDLVQRIFALKTQDATEDEVE